MRSFLGGSSATIIGLALAMIVWLDPTGTLTYQTKFSLFSGALIVLGIGIYGLISTEWCRRKRASASDKLSEEISWAIHNLLNRRLAVQPVLTQDYDKWCAGVEAILKNKSLFTKTELLHFQHLGVIPELAFTENPSVDHTLSMLSLKIERLREIIHRPN